MSTNVYAKSASKVAILPQFVIHDHQKFRTFLKAYYEWMASQGADLAFEAIKLSNDVDLVIDEMLGNYKASYAPLLPEKMKTDFRFFARFLKEFYQIKGSPESYRILFRALYGVEAEVYFPREQLFQPSASEWQQKRYSLIRAIQGNPFDLIHSAIEEAEFSLVVDDVVSKGSNLYHLYWEHLEGDIVPNRTIRQGAVQFEFLPVYQPKAVRSAPAYHEGRVIAVDGLTLKVDKVYYAKIEDIQIEQGGLGYKVDDLITTQSSYRGTGFSANVSQVSPDGAIEAVKVLSKGFGYEGDFVFKIKTDAGTGASLIPTMGEGFKKIQHLSVIQNKHNEEGEVTKRLPDGTEIDFVPTTQMSNHGWENAKGMPSTHHAKIHDSDYYQEFSYDIRSSASPENVSDIKNLLQIAGLKMFITSRKHATGTIPSDFA